MHTNMTTLNAMINKGIKNEVPETVLQNCGADDRVLVENLLLLAQAELESLQLASATVCKNDKKTVVQCPFAGTDCRLSLSAMQSMQNYSPARVFDVSARMAQGIFYLCFEIGDANARISCTELEVVRVAKKKRLLFKC